MNIPDTSLSPLLEIFDNAVLAWGLIACGLAQLSKVLVELFLNKNWNHFSQYGGHSIPVVVYIFQNHSKSS